MGLYQFSSNYSPWVKFDPTPGVTSGTWDYIWKTLEFSLYIAIRPMNFFSNYSLGVKFDSTPGVTSGTWDYIGETLEFSLYIAMRSRVTTYCM